MSDERTTLLSRPAAEPATRTAPGGGDLSTRFRTLVQSPLRAGILRYLFSREPETFDVEALMSVFGRMRLDVDNCVAELAGFGVARRLPGTPAKYAANRPDSEAVTALLEEFLDRRAMVSMEDQSPSVQRFREMIGRDEKMMVVFEWIRTAAKSDISVLILGPTGSGKEVVARMIHELSRRGGNKFQAVNCAALPDTLFESEIFGHEKGAYTGAHDRKPGRLELANHGTLFLDEIGDMSLVAQAKLLRVLEERRFERLGGNRAIEVDFRLISATNRPLEQFVRENRFREDLYYRVNAFSIRLPSLRERQVDIPVLAQRFLARVLRGQRPANRQQDVRPGGPGPADGLPLARQHPGTREHRLEGRPVGAGSVDPRVGHRLPPPGRDGGRAIAGAPPVAAGHRTRPYREGPRRRRLEQEGGGRDPRYQPRDALPQDRRIRPQASQTPCAPHRYTLACRSRTTAFLNGVVANFSSRILVHG